MRPKRFGDRAKRLSRRHERDTFRRQLMPLSIFVGCIGVAGWMFLLIDYFVTARWSPTLGGLCAALVLLPFVVMGLGFFRGHHSRGLDEP